MKEVLQVAACAGIEPLVKRPLFSLQGTRPLLPFAKAAATLASISFQFVTYLSGQPFFFLETRKNTELL